MLSVWLVVSHVSVMVVEVSSLAHDNLTASGAAIAAVGLINSPKKTNLRIDDISYGLAHRFGIGPVKATVRAKMTTIWGPCSRALSFWAS